MLGMHKTLTFWASFKREKAGIRAADQHTFVPASSHGYCVVLRSSDQRPRLISVSHVEGRQKLLCQTEINRALNWYTPHYLMCFRWPTSGAKQNCARKVLGSMWLFDDVWGTYHFTLMQSVDRYQRRMVVLLMNTDRMQVFKCLSDYASATAEARRNHR